MRIHNVHERRFDARATEVGALIDGLAGPVDNLWPHRWWPAMRFDRPLGVGARGGHGPVRYTVCELVPGQRVRFTFTGPAGLSGEHRFELVGEPGAPVLRHTAEGRASGAMRLGWPLVFRPLHDALLEDALDGAQRALRGQRRAAPRWPRWVRVLRRALAGRSRASARSYGRYH